ncbi:MAG: diguanylate cyclase, partial [Gemmatimonadaceae bacterium]|nr:diguanylate cyclase [Gemmatimonadaceae bacterium]
MPICQGGVSLEAPPSSSTSRPPSELALQDPVAAHQAEEQANAEILLWQGRYRAVFISLVGFSTITLKWFGVISSDSVFVERIGLRPALLWVLALIVAYLLLHRVLVWHLRRAGRASRGLAVAAIASDMVSLFTAVALMTPPEHYDRALIVSIFTVQLTQLFFGWTVTVANLLFVGIGYTGLIALAADAGAATSPPEELWTLALYAIGVLVYVGLQGHVAQRMRSLVQVFTKAQDGDFSARYDEGADQMPDPVTVIGRAYNKMRSHLETIVLTDPLSGCFNRRGLNQLAEREVSRAVRAKKNIAVLAIDVDHFKHINDEYGHLTGDEVIREVGALLRETARDVDVVARIGGEEFTILAPDSNDEGALILAERVMQAFRQHQFRSLPPERRITTSVGVAAAPARDDEVAKTLLARADEALYVAKRNGRDRAVVWHAGMRAFDGAAHGRAR